MAFETAAIIFISPELAEILMSDSSEDYEWN